MAINRYSNLQYSTMRDLPLLQIPFDQLDSVLGSYQQKKDINDQLAGTTPKYIQESERDVALAGKVTSYQNKITSELSDIAKSGNVGQYMSALSSAQKNMLDLWKPGGAAHSLQSRYTEYQKAKEEIKDHTKDFKNPLYNQYFTDGLTSQLKGKGEIYNPAMRTYSPISSPNLFAETDIGSEVDTFLKDWAEDKNYDIQLSKDGYWYIKNTTEEVSEKELRSALDNFYNQPHIQQALAVQSHAVKKNITPELANQVVMEATGIRNTKNAQLEADAKKELDSLKKKLNSGVPAEVREAQTLLKAAGYYEGGIDEISGENSEAAFAKFEKDINKRIEETKETGQITIDDVVDDQIKGSFTNTYVPKYSYSHKDVKFISNAPAIARLRASLRYTNDQKMIKALLASDNQTLKQPITLMENPVPTVLNSYNESKETYEALEKSYYNGNVAFEPIRDAFALDASPTTNGFEVLTVAKRAADQVADENLNIDPAAYKAALIENGLSPDHVNAMDINGQIEMLKSADKRYRINTFVDDMRGAYQTYELDMEQMTHLVDKLQTKLDWKDIAYKSGVGMTKKQVPSGPYATSTVHEYNIEETQRAFARGDEKVVNTVNRTIDNMAQEDKNEFFDVSAVDVLINKNLDPFLKEADALINTGLTSMIDVNNVSEYELNKLGFDKKGNALVDNQGKPVDAIKKPYFGVKNVNGKSEIVLIAGSKLSTEPVVFSTDQMNKDWLRGAIKNFAAATINPNDPTKIRDPEMLNTLAGVMFDIDISADNLTATRIKTVVDNNGTRSLGSFDVTVGGNTNKINVDVIKDADTQETFLVGSDDKWRQRLESYSTPNGYNLTEFVLENNINENSDNFTRELIDGDLNSIKAGLLDMKSKWQLPVLLHELETNPVEIKTSRTNVTPLMNLMIGRN